MTAPKWEGWALSWAVRLLGLTGGISRSQSRELRALFTDAYIAIRKQKAFAGVHSAVPYCLATRLHTQGHAYLYIPPRPTSDSPQIVMLHGFGGNLLFQIHALVEEFPRAIILAPSWQINWSDGPVFARIGLIRDALRAASEAVGFELASPWLFGISQGGVAAFELLPSIPGLFAGMVGISTGAQRPPTADFPHIPVLIVHGKADDRIGIDTADSTVAALLDLGIPVTMGEIADADHFLLLSHRRQFGKFVRERAFAEGESLERSQPELAKSVGP